MGSRGSKPLLLDGALGTELERRGVDTRGMSWTAYANRSHADLIGDIHSEYIAAGADIITANTFRTNSRAVGDNAESLTKEAVAIARVAVARSGKRVLVAGSIAPAEDCFSPELVDASTESLEAEHLPMMEWLSQAGVDLILIETMNTAREAVAAVRAAKRGTILPVYVSLVPKSGDTLLDGSPLADALLALAEAGADLVALNCAPVSVMQSARDVFVHAAREMGLAFGCYPNASERDSNGRWDLNASSNDDIAVVLEEWLDAGASLIGSCCGTTATTTTKLRNLIDRRV